GKERLSVRDENVERQAGLAGSDQFMLRCAPDRDERIAGDRSLQRLHGGRDLRVDIGDALALVDDDRSRVGADGLADGNADTVEAGKAGKPRDAEPGQQGPDPAPGLVWTAYAVRTGGHLSMKPPDASMNPPDASMKPPETASADVASAARLTPLTT